MASTSNINTADLLPDLSHLTEEEKQIIQNVMYRQQQEEAKEHEIVRRKADEVKILEDTIRQRNEQQRKAGVGLDTNATCQLCLKTKFADGIGHCCTYCGVRCCARCGGKVTLRSNKTIWVCILCRKKQELLIKTGQWINQPSCATPEKENRGPFSYSRAPLIRASSLQNQEPTRALPTPQLRRQYSQEDRVPPNSNFPHYPYHGPGPGVHGYPRRASSSEPPELTHGGSGYYDSPYDHYGGRSYISGGVMDYHGQPPQQQPPHHPQQQPQVLPHQQIQIQQIGPSGVQQYPIPLQGTGRTLPQPKIPLQTDTSTSWSPPYERKVIRHQLPKVPGGVKPLVSSPGGVNLQVQQQYRHPHHHQQQQGVQNVGGHSTIHVSVGGHQRSPSSSEEELRSTPDYTSGDDQNGRHGHHGRIQQVPVYQHTRRDIKSPFETPSPAGSGGSQGSQIPGGGISGGVNLSGNNNNNSNNNNFHRYHGPPERRRGDRSTRTKKTVRFDSDDFIGGSGGPGDVGQNIQQQQGPGGLPNISSSTGVVGGGQVVGQQDWFLWDQASSAGSAERQGSQDSTTKDSGIDTCSNFTSSEDSNRELISSTKHHVSWRPNNDGSKLIGHMILKKDLGGMDGHGSSAHILGLKVVGGQVLENGRIGALVEKIKKYSPADVIGRVQVGDEVIEWNGRSLMDKTYDEVYDIISESKQDGQVELIVSRGFSGTGGNLPGPSKTYLNIRKDYRRPSVTITSPSSPDPRGIAGGAQSGGKFGPVVQQGKIQLKICFDPNMNQLMVTVLRACDLNCKHGVPSPFVKLCLLPDRSEKWKRRTRTLSSSREPRWNQNFVFSPLRHAEVRCRALQVSVWDCDLSRSQDGNPPVPEYLGETSIELSNHPLDDEPEWHFLTWDRNSSLYLETESNNPPHLSPPSLSTTSRHSDSDNSELDYERRLEIASISSSSSPPPDDLSGGVDPRRSRRDMSPLDKRQIHTDPDGYRRSVSASTQFRSKSPPRSYSPQTVHYQQQQHIDEYNTMGPQGPPHLRSAHRSASGTPQGSPKKRQLPIIPQGGGRGQNMSQDIDERARQMRSKMRSSLSASSSYSSRGPSLENDGSLRSNRGISPDRSYIMDREWADPRLDSDLESVTSAFSTQSENPNRLSKPPSCQSACTSATYSNSQTDSSPQTQNLLQSAQTQRLPDNSHVLDQPHLFTSEYAMRHPKRSLGTRSLSSETAPDKADGSLSDTAVNMAPSSLDRPRGGHRMGTSPQRLTPQNMAGLSKKSNSTSQLSATGRKRRIGFGRSKGGIGVNRSEEVLPDLSQMGSSFSSEDMSQDNSDSSWMPKMGPGSASSSTTGGLGSGQGSSSEGGRITDFIEGLGPGQLVGRQVLASPALGDIQLSLCDRRGSLEVEVVRARGLQAKTGAKLSKITPAPYVKVYLVRGKKCVAKAKTGIARRTLDPLYQQQLVFREKYQSCILQVTVWGDYGRIEGRKVFMGVSQIMLDDLDLTNIVIGWYKLCPHIY